jgi:putative ABC transport system substrate-binding protein
MTVGAIFVARRRMAELAIQHHMATIGVPATADSGVLMAYGTDAAAIFRRGAVLVDRILRGTKPADIPVEQPNVHELVVNLRTARALGIELPRSLMLQVTRAID